MFSEDRKKSKREPTAELDKSDARLSAHGDAISDPHVSQLPDIYRSFIRNFHGIIFRIDENFVVQFIAGRIEEVTGYRPEEFLSGTVPFVHIIHPDDIPRIVDERIEPFSTPGYRVSLEHRIVRRDGTVGWVHSHIESVDDASFSQRFLDGAMHDITDMVLIRHAMGTNEENIKALINSFDEIMMLIDEEGNLINCNNALAKRHGTTTEDLIGRNVYGFLPSARARERRSYQRIVHDTGKHVHFEDNREERAYENEIYPVFNSEGKVTKVAVISRDITERKNMEAALIESNEKFRLLSQSSPMGTFYTDAEGRVLFTNRKWQEITGINLEDSLGFGWVRALHPDDKERILVAWNECLKEKTGYSGEFRFLTPDGEIKWVYTRTEPVKSSKGHVIGHVGANEDITERRKMEEEIQKSQKLESVGILAGGIAHDFNNILAGILGNISLAKAGVEPDGSTYKLLSESETACTRASELTYQLLTFAKGGTPVKRVHPVPDLLKESCSFSLRGANVRCDHDVANDLWLAEIDPGQISQVINNVIINACQAMPEGGVIGVSASNVTIYEGDSRSLQPGKYVKVTIRDEGHGIIKEYLPKIFDPFFTTKEKGSGLGLATSYSILRKHHGLIEADSEVGQGTVFTIYLPAAEEDDEEERRSLSEVVTFVNRRMLVMDDESMVMGVLVGMLSFLGCETEVCSEGAEAIEKYKAAIHRGRPFDAVILDLTVPGGIGGLETVKKLKDIDPKVKAIVASGYSNDPVLVKPEKFGFVAMVSKPFRLEELSFAVSKAFSV